MMVRLPKQAWLKVVVAFEALVATLAEPRGSDPFIRHLLEAKAAIADLRERVESAEECEEV